MGYPRKTQPSRIKGKLESGHRLTLTLVHTLSSVPGHALSPDANGSQSESFPLHTECMSWVHLVCVGFFFLSVFLLHVELGVSRTEEIRELARPCPGTPVEARPQTLAQSCTLSTRTCFNL